MVKFSCKPKKKYCPIRVRQHTSLEKVIDHTKLKIKLSLIDLICVLVTKTLGVTTWKITSCLANHTPLGLYQVFRVPISAKGPVSLQHFRHSKSFCIVIAWHDIWHRIGTGYSSLFFSHSSGSKGLVFPFSQALFLPVGSQSSHWKKSQKRLGHLRYYLPGFLAK